MTRLWAIGVLALLGASAAWPQRDFPPDIFDTRPVALDPTHFIQVFENSRVSVMRVQVAPHEKTMIVEIPAHVMTCLTDQHIRVIRPRGKPVERTLKAGYSGWVERDEYGIENLGDTRIEWIVVTPKSKDSSGQSPA